MVRHLFVLLAFLLCGQSVVAQEVDVHQRYLEQVPDGTTQFQTKRPPMEERLFTSKAVERKIAEVERLLRKNAKLAWMFGNCFPNTLESTVHFTTENGQPNTFVYTGDIPAMWLRDASAQVFPYVALAKNDSELRQMLRGLIHRLFHCINVDRYANAFNDGPTGGGWQTDETDMQPEVFERKYEIDSLCYPIRLAYAYWLATGDTSIFDSEWLQAVQNILTTFEEQQRKTNRGPYHFYRVTDRTYDTVGWGGYGAPIKPVGLIASVFRPSDDRTDFPFLIPSNFMAVNELRHMSEILSSVNQQTSQAQRANQLAEEVHQALQQYAVVDHPKYGKIYALEVDGFGNRLLADDANVPSLLSLGYLIPTMMQDEIYQNTRQFVWSKDNPWFFRGTNGEGIGGPHVGVNMAWPMSIMMKAFTATSDEEIRQCMRWLLTTDANTGFMHESFDVNDPKHYSRDWFAWQNTLFGELVLTLIERGKTDLLIHCLD